MRFRRNGYKIPVRSRIAVHSSASHERQTHGDYVTARYARHKGRSADRAYVPRMVWRYFVSSAL